MKLDLLLLSCVAAFAPPRSPRRAAASLRPAAEPSHFEELTGLDARLCALQTRESSMLLAFYDDELASFSISPALARRFSITSTSAALLAIAANPGGWRGLAGCADGDAVCLPRVMSALLDAEWRADDLVQATLIIVAWREFDPTGALVAPHAARFSKAVDSVLAARPRRREGRNQQTSAYLTFWGVRATVSLLSGAASGAATRAGGDVRASVARDAADSPRDAGYLTAALPEPRPPSAAARAALALQRAAGFARRALPPARVPARGDDAS